MASTDCSFDDLQVSGSEGSPTGRDRAQPAFTHIAKILGSGALPKAVGLPILTAYLPETTSRPTPNDDDR